MTWHTLDVTNVLALWRMLHSLMSWQTFWRHGTFWQHDTLFDVMSNSMTSWCVVTFCWHDVFLTPWPAFCLDIFVFIISGTKHNENVFLIFCNTVGKLWPISAQEMQALYSIIIRFSCQPCFMWEVFRSMNTDLLELVISNTTDRVTSSLKN